MKPLRFSPGVNKGTVTHHVFSDNESTGDAFMGNRGQRRQQSRWVKKNGGEMGKDKRTHY